MCALGKSPLPYITISFRKASTDTAGYTSTTDAWHKQKSEFHVAFWNGIRNDEVWCWLAATKRPHKALATIRDNRENEDILTFLKDIDHIAQLIKYTCYSHTHLHTAIISNWHTKWLVMRARETQKYSSSSHHQCQYGEEHDKSGKIHTHTRVYMVHAHILVAEINWKLNDWKLFHCVICPL